MGGGAEAEPYVETRVYDGILEAENPYNRAFLPQTLVLAASRDPLTYTCDARSALAGVWDKKTGPGLVACFAAQYPLSGGLVLILGCPKSERERRQILNLREPEKARAALEQVRQKWHGLLGRWQVKTPDRLMDTYLNGWALYQAISCRLWGRSSLYQNGGAYGFRDQLQDVCALTTIAPDMTRQQILKACAHQFEEGDVQHWWHPEDLDGGAEKGVRTRYTDDLLWLTYTVCRYVEQTGDEAVLEERIPFLCSPVLRENEGERYETPQVSQEKGTVLEHAQRALQLALQRGVGLHGLSKIGGGDWNDGMNRVGEKGKGESVWLTWFMAHVAEQFAALLHRHGEENLAGRLKEQAKALASAANSAWDGAWFLRGYYDDGQTLGSHNDMACQIDSIAQSFGSLTEFADRDKVRQGLQSALDRLFDKEHQIVKLFTPPFVTREPDPGYIAGYPAGVRENGGQYTHAAIWLAMGCLREGMTEEGAEILKALLPGRHDQAIYQAEPYVIAADVYSNPAHPGRGGWSWYTGAAAWYYRVAMEELLGLQVKEGRLTVTPRLPQTWQGFEAQWKTETGSIQISVNRGERASMTFDGVEVKENAFSLRGEGAHTLQIIVAEEEPAAVPAVALEKQGEQSRCPARNRKPKQAK